MDEIRAVEAEPGGKLTLWFSPHGFATCPMKWSESTAFRVLVTVLFVVFALSVLTTVLAEVLGLPDEVMVVAMGAVTLPLLAAGVVGVRLILRDVRDMSMLPLFLVTLPVSLPLVVVSSRARAFFGLGKPTGAPGTTVINATHVVQGRVITEGAATVVTLQLVDGAVLRYRAHGKAGQDLSAGMARLLGPHLVTQD